MWPKESKLSQNVLRTPPKFAHTFFFSEGPNFLKNVQINDRQIGFLKFRLFLTGQKKFNVNTIFEPTGMLTELHHRTVNMTVNMSSMWNPHNYLHELSQKLFLKIPYPITLNGIQFNAPDPNLIRPYKAMEEIPSYFWISEIIRGPLPNNPATRRALLYDILDLYHYHLCNDVENKHNSPSENCRCNLCGARLGRYHFRECIILFDLTPCEKFRFLKLFWDKNPLPSMFKLKANEGTFKVLL